LTLLAELGARIRAQREQRGWTRAHLAQRAGISLRFLADVEHGDGNLSVQRLSEIAQALGMPFGALTADLGDAPSGPKIALVGLRGAGKSTIGAALAASLGWAFVEVDARVEDAAGMRLGDLFESLGAGRYRELEHEVLVSLLASGAPAVLATGGSVVTAPDTWDLLRRRARTVWLRASPESHIARVEAQGDLRPTMGRANALAELNEILLTRSPLYAQAALTVDTDGRSIADAVETIRRAG